MPDNVDITRPDPSAPVEIIAADEIIGSPTVKVQRIKVGFGGDGFFGDVHAGNQLPVTISDPINVTLVGGGTLIIIVS